MAGTFSKSARPALAGSYFNWEAESQQTLEPAIGGIVAVPSTAEWGPIRTAVLLGSWDEYTGIFGSGDCPLRRAVWGAFKGEGRPGHVGAGSVLVYRMGTNAAAEATKVINNTAAAPALTLTALYKGTRGNDFRVTTQASLISGKTELLLLDGALVVEKYTFNTAYSSGDAAALVAQINSQSNWVSAASGTTGVALATVTSQAFTGGNDGDTLTTAEWLQAQDAFDSERWAIIAAYAMTDSAVRAAFVAWIQQRNTLGHRSMAVIGGAAGESVATGNTRSTTINDWDIVNVVGATMHLDDLGFDASTSELTARVAGSIANRGEVRDLIYARFADISPATGASLATVTEQEAALAAGSTVFAQDTNATAPIFIKEGVTTYTNDAQSPLDEDGNKKYPVFLYKRIKNLRIQHGIELEVEDWATTGDVLGQLPVNDRTRALVKGFLTSIYQRREDAEIIQPGWTVVLDSDPAPDDDQDFIQYEHGFHPTRSLRQLYNTARIG